MSLTKQGQTLVFDQVLNTNSGAITGVIMRPITYPNVNVGVEPVESVSISFNSGGCSGNSGDAT
jgi:hypothetical protein